MLKKTGSETLLEEVHSILPEVWAGKGVAALKPLHFWKAGSLIYLAPLLERKLIIGPGS